MNGTNDVTAYADRVYGKRFKLPSTGELCF